MPSRPATRLLIVLSLLSSLASAQVWQKKPYSQWTRSETQEVLDHSPWSKVVRVGSSDADLSRSAPSTRGARPGAITAGVALNRGVTYLVQLRSALPMRDAIARTAQLDRNYDRMSSQEKAAFDAKTNAYLAQKFPDTVVVYVTYASNEPDYIKDLREYWRQQSVDSLRGTTFLTANGEKAPLVGFAAGEQVFQFVFPRPRNLAGDATFEVEFVHPKIADLVPVMPVPLPDGTPVPADVRGFPGNGVGQLRLVFSFPLRTLLFRDTPEY